MDASDILTNGRRITPFAPTGGEKIWIIRMAPEWRGGNMGLEYGRRSERSNAKNSNKRERQKREESKRAAKTEWQRGGRG